MNGLPIAVAFVLSLLGSAVWYYFEQGSEDALIYGGMPERVESGWRNWYRVLHNEGYLTGYSDLRLNPLWVSYRLKALTPEQKQRGYKRPGQFSEDWRTLWRVQHEDYTRTGYDRGHLAPNYAISRLHGREAQLETFLMTNIVPQKPDLNRKAWQRLEEIGVDHFTRQFHEVAVITGPIFDQNIERLDSWVEIPDAFFKIFVGLDAQGKPKSMLAFLFPQDVRGNEPLNQFVVSVDTVEQKTGFNFFPKLDDIQQTRLEALQNDPAWKLSDVARLPARFK